MASTPNQVFDHLKARGYRFRRGRHHGDYPGGGHRFGFYSSGTMIANQITLTSDPTYPPTPCCWGYLNMKHFRVGDLTPQEIGNINKSQTMRIHHITLERLTELLDILEEDN
jgi:hypothetical protein